MKYSVCQWIYGGLSIREIMKRLAGWGYDGIELAGECREIGTEELHKLLKMHELETTCICPAPDESGDLSNFKEAVRKKTINSAKHRLNFAQQIGASFIIIIPSQIGKIQTLKNFDDEWKWAVESVQELAKHAEQVNVSIAIEVLNRYEARLINTVDQALKFIQQINSDKVKILLDTYHMNIEERDPVDAIRNAGKNLIHLHVADNNRQGIGRGQINFLPIMRTLKQIDYNNTIGIETTAPGPNPFQAIKDKNSEKFVDMYLKESINMLRIYEEVI